MMYDFLKFIVISDFRQSCIGLEPSESHNFLDVFLPSVAENLLTISRKVQMKYIKTSSVSIEWY